MPVFLYALLLIISSRFLYPLNISIKQKIETICREIYGADSVEYSEQAEHRIEVHNFIFNCIYCECVIDGIIGVH